MTPAATRPDAPRDLGPAVPFPPPLLFVGVFALAALLERVAPLPFDVPASLRSPLAVGAGLLLVAAGLALVATGIATFRRARTAVYPNRPARNLVTHGIYRFTRNPMYLGFVVASLGGVLATSMSWALLLLPLAIVGVRTLVIAREERHLRERFPAEYAAYTRETRRWL